MVVLITSTSSCLSCFTILLTSQPEMLFQVQSGHACGEFKLEERTPEAVSCQSQANASRFKKLPAVSLNCARPGLAT